MTKQRAINVTVTTFSADCGQCGGGAIDNRTGSFMLEYDSIRSGLSCHDCGVKIIVKNKTARL